MDVWVFTGESGDYDNWNTWVAGVATTIHEARIKVGQIYQKNVVDAYNSEKEMFKGWDEINISKETNPRRHLQFEIEYYDIQEENNQVLDFQKIATVRSTYDYKYYRIETEYSAERFTLG